MSKLQWAAACASVLLISLTGCASSGAADHSAAVAGNTKASAAPEKIEAMALVDIVKKFGLHATPATESAIGQSDVSYSLPKDPSEKTLRQLIQTVGAATTSEKVLFTGPSSVVTCSNQLLLTAGQPLLSETPSVAHLLAQSKNAGCWRSSTDYFGIENSPLDYSHAADLAYSASLLLNRHVGFGISGKNAGMSVPSSDGYSINQGESDGTVSETWLNNPALIVKGAKAVSAANASTGKIVKYQVNHGCLGIQWEPERVAPDHEDDGIREFRGDYSSLKSIPNYKACVN